MVIRIKGNDNESQVGFLVSPSVFYNRRFCYSNCLLKFPKLYCNTLMEFYSLNFIIFISFLLSIWLKLESKLRYCCTVILLSRTLCNSPSTVCQNSITVLSWLCIVAHKCQLWRVHTSLQMLGTGEEHMNVCM